MTEQEARPAPEIHVTDIVLPNQTNNFNTMFGGEVMALMDKAAAIAGLRFCRQPLVTASPRAALGSTTRQWLRR